METPYNLQTRLLSYSKRKRLQRERLNLFHEIAAVRKASSRVKTGHPGDRPYSPSQMDCERPIFFVAFELLHFISTAMAVQKIPGDTRDPSQRGAGRIAA